MVSNYINTITRSCTCVSKCFDDQGVKSVSWFYSLLPHASITKVGKVIQKNWSNTNQVYYQSVCSVLVTKTS